MKRIAVIFIISFLILTALLWKLALNLSALNCNIEKAVFEINQIKEEQHSLAKYKSGKPILLEKFYLGVFNDIKELSFYYQVPSEIKIIGAKDLVNIRSFFRGSQYKGIKYIDLACSFDLRKQRNAYLLDAFYKTLKSKPIDVLDINLEKGIITITMRLYGI